MDIFATGNLYTIKDNDWQEFLSDIKRVKESDTLVVAGKTLPEQLDDLEKHCKGLVVSGEPTDNKIREMYVVKDGEVSSIWKQSKQKNSFVLLAPLDNLENWEQVKDDLEKNPSADCIIFSTQLIDDIPTHILKHKQVKSIIYANRSIPFPQTYQGRIGGYGQDSCRVSQIDVRFLQNRVTLVANLSDYGFLSIKDPEMVNEESLSWKYTTDETGEYNKSAIVDTISYHQDILYHPVNRQSFLEWLETNKTSRLNQLESTNKYAKFVQKYEPDELLEFILLREQTQETVEIEPIKKSNDPTHEEWIKFMCTHPLEHTTVKQLRTSNFYRFDYQKYKAYLEPYGDAFTVGAILLIEQAAPQTQTQTQTTSFDFMFDTLSQLRAEKHPYYLEFQDLFELFDEVMTPNQIDEFFLTEEINEIEDILFDVDDIDMTIKDFKQYMHVGNQKAWDVWREDVSVGELLSSFFAFPDIMANGLPDKIETEVSQPTKIIQSSPSPKKTLKSQQEWEEIHQQFWELSQQNPSEQDLHDWVENILEQHTF